jgi:hypothetical protein
MPKRRHAAQFHYKEGAALPGRIPEPAPERVVVPLLFVVAGDREVSNVASVDRPFRLEGKRNDEYHYVEDADAAVGAEEMNIEDALLYPMSDETAELLYTEKLSEAQLIADVLSGQTRR